MDGCQFEKGSPTPASTDQVLSQAVKSYRLATAAARRALFAVLFKPFGQPFGVGLFESAFGRTGVGKAG
jgi:hypothetical protein